MTTQTGPAPHPPTAHPDPLGWLGARAAEREVAGLRRRLTARAAVDPVLDLAGNDYLGLSRLPAVVEGGVAALRAWGAGATGSRLVTGTTTLHLELEDALAGLAGADAGLVFSSGYTANLGALTALTGAGDLVVSDALNHASIVDACRLSRAEVAIAPHADVAAVERLLARRAAGRRALVVVDAVFSTDGDLAPLAALHAACRRQGAVLLVDEAHSLGVVGDGGHGALAAAGLAGASDIVATASLAKAFGAQGGVVLGSRAVRDHLVDAARTFIFDTGLAPASAGAALAAVRELTARPGLAAASRERATALAASLAVPAPAAAIVRVLVGDPRRAVAAAARCLDAGVRVGCFRPPSVPPGTSRLRLAARSDLTTDDVMRVAAVVRAACATG